MAVLHWLLVFGVASTCLADPWIPSQPTATLIQAPRYGIAPAPKPTTAPPYPAHLLAKRSFGSDNTCGYISGALKSSLTCNSVSTCIASGNYMGCSSGATSHFYTACLNAAAASACTTCSSAGDVLSCTANGFTACATYLFNSRFNGSSTPIYNCAQTAFVVGALTTYTDIATPSFTATSNTSAAEPTMVMPPMHKGSSTGVVVGGVLGALALITLIGIAALLYFRLRKPKQPQITVKSISSPLVYPDSFNNEDMAHRPSTSHSTTVSAYGVTPVSSPGPGAAGFFRKGSDAGSLYSPNSGTPYSPSSLGDYKSPATPQPMFTPSSPLSTAEVVEMDAIESSRAREMQVSRLRPIMQGGPVEIGQGRHPSASEQGGGGGGGSRLKFTDTPRDAERYEMAA